MSERAPEALVSVVVPAFNAARWIADALRSVKAQTHREIEVLVVDNGSTDATVSAALAADPHARVLHASTRGPSAAKNVGLVAAGGEFVQFLDADDFLEPSKIARHVAAAGRTGADVVWGGYTRLAPRGAGFDRGPTIVPALDERDLLHGLITADGFLPLAAALFRRDSPAGVVRFDETRRVVEDVQWLVALEAAGATFAKSDALPGLEVREHDSASRASRIGDAAFFRACADNAAAVADHWRARGAPIDGARRETLVELWLYAAEMLARTGDPAARTALGRALEFDPAAVTRLRQPLRSLARVAGFERGMRYAGYVGRARDLLRRAVRR